jgi:aminoglycoside phosphotransferase (APT) family kinase protein
MPHTAKQAALEAFLHSTEWIRPPFSISFLAAGEYNENHLVVNEDGRYVLRINHGSQLGLGPRQIEYEFQVLKALEPTGVTPRAFFCEPDPGTLHGGVLLMEYIQGRPLDYRQDMAAAADILARVHSLPVPEGLVVQDSPVQDIARECWELLHRYPDHPLVDEKRQILSYFKTVQQMAEETRDLFAAEKLSLVNTEVNSGNFLIGPDRACLVDWEKAVASHRYQDLGHFLVPTTTLWKTETVYTRDDKASFLELYRKASGLNMDLEELVFRTAVLEKTILLRALSWCFMAFYEYTRTDRPIQNQDTFAKIKQYLGDIPWILSSVA